MREKVVHQEKIKLLWVNYYFVLTSEVHGGLQDEAM